MSIISTGPASPHPPGSIEDLRCRLESLESQLVQLQRNRPASPLVTDPPRNGHTPVYNMGTLPVLGELTWHMQGALVVVAAGAPRHTRWHANIVAAVVDLGSYAGGTITFGIAVAGTPISGSPFTINSGNLVPSGSGGSAWFPVSPPWPMNAYVDLAVPSVSIVDASQEMVIALELG